MLMFVGHARRVSNEKQTPNKVQTDNPTIVICFWGKELFVEGSCSWRHFLCGAAAALNVGGQKILDAENWIHLKKLRTCNLRQ